MSTRRLTRTVVAVLAIALVASACSSSATRTQPTGRRLSPQRSTSGISARSSVQGSTQAHLTESPTSTLRGVVVGIDPGHNGSNFAHASEIDRWIWNGREREHCNTTGTETDSGYTESLFNFRLAMLLSADLRAAGARVVLTRHSNTGVGPCVNRRAAILNEAPVAVAIDIHADGGPATGRGFAILEPVADAINRRVVGASLRLGLDVRREFLRTGMPVSSYDGQDGLVRRDDLAGLNLTRVPIVLLECGNMRNHIDAQMLTSPAFQARAARALERAMASFLHGR